MTEETRVRNIEMPYLESENKVIDEFKQEFEAGRCRLDWTREPHHQPAAAREELQTSLHGYSTRSRPAEACLCWPPMPRHPSAQGTRGQLRLRPQCNRVRAFDSDFPEAGCHVAGQDFPEAGCHVVGQATKPHIVFPWSRRSAYKDQPSTPPPRVRTTEPPSTVSTQLSEPAFVFLGSFGRISFLSAYDRQAELTGSRIS